MVGRIAQAAVGILFLCCVPVALGGTMWSVRTRSSKDPRTASVAFAVGWFGIIMLALAILPVGTLRDWFYYRSLGLAFGPVFFTFGVICLTLAEDRMKKVRPSIAKRNRTSDLVDNAAERNYLGVIALIVGSWLPNRAALDLTGAFLAALGLLTMISVFRPIDLENTFSPTSGHLGRFAIVVAVWLAAGELSLLIVNGVRRGYRRWRGPSHRDSPP